MKTGPHFQPHTGKVALTPEQRQKLRKLCQREGLNKAALILGFGSETIRGAAENGLLTMRTHDRLVAALEQVT